MVVLLHLTLSSEDEGMPQTRASHTADEAYEPRGASALSRFLSGLLAFSAGVFICGACGSYSPTDASFNSAVSAVLDPETGAVLGPDNLFGAAGAAVADLMTQGFGWTAWLMGFALMVGGLRRTLGMGQRDSAAWMWGMLAVVFAACCLAEWPIPKSWVLSAGLGGVVGDVLLAIAATPFAALKVPDAQMWASMLAGVTAILFAAMAMGLGASDGASLWRALTRKPERPAQQAMPGLPALTSQPAGGAGFGAAVGAMVGRLLGKKPEEVIEPIVYTEEDGFEEGDRGFFTAVEKAEGADGRTRPITPRVLESRPIPEGEATSCRHGALAAQHRQAGRRRALWLCGRGLPRAGPRGARCLLRGAADRTARRAPAALVRRR